MLGPYLKKKTKPLGNTFVPWVLLMFVPWVTDTVSSIEQHLSKKHLLSQDNEHIHNGSQTSSGVNI